MKISFREVDPDDAKMLLDWRTSERITRYMITDVEYSTEKQKKWIEESYTKKDYYHWIVQINQKPAGLININQSSPESNKIFWGYYLGDKEYSGTGGFIPPFLYNWLFNTANIDEISCEAVYFNINTIKLNMMQGYSFAPTSDRVITKKGEEILLVSQSLLKTTWQSMKRYHAMIADFPIKKWTAAPERVQAV